MLVNTKQRSMDNHEAKKQKQTNKKQIARGHFCQKLTLIETLLLYFIFNDL